MGSGLAIGQFHLDSDLRFAAHGVAFFVGLHADVQLMRLGADADLCYAETEGRFAQIDQSARGDIFTAFVPKGRPPLARCFVAPGEERVPRHFTQTPAQCKHTHVHIRPPAVFDGELNGRILAIELNDLGFDNALAFHSHQSRGKAEGHAHLKFGDFARLVDFFLGQDVHAVMVFTTKPDLTLFGHRDRAGRLHGVAVFVFGGDDQLHFTGLTQLGFTQ